MCPCTPPIYFLSSVFPLQRLFLPWLVSVWFTLVPRAFVCPLRSVVTDGSWQMNQRQIHYHLARAIMHLNYIAGTLPFFEPAIDWEDSEPPPHHQPILPPQSHHIHNRHLHTFSMPSSSSASVISHGGLPSHMVLNPEPHLRPMVTPSSTPAIPGNPPSKRHGTTIFLERLPNRSSSSVVPARNPPTLTPALPNPEARPKKKQRGRLDRNQDRSVPPPPESVPTGVCRRRR